LGLSTGRLHFRRTKPGNAKRASNAYVVVWEKIGNSWKLAADIWNEGK
jgi:ketosteroid isomerase-like protein